ncbi:MULTISPECIES: ABC transporter permease [Actinoplanes]|uniref:ABC transporter permease n=1 Tax=Actinoplanes TaxID=1865 RepID=UPI0005F2EA78|nr:MULTISPECIES: ABC transporter permease [Actinoplanes]GLY04824.1 hypothetical protein Acsp01_52030 [Actinoplanes sp. NBRC 101535]
MTTFAATRLVMAREIKVKIRDKTFLFSTVFLLLFAVGGTVLPSLFDGGATRVAVVGAPTAAVLEQAGLDVRTVPDEATAEQLVRSGDVDAAVVDGPRVLALDETPGDVVGALSTAPPVQLLDPDDVDPVARFIVPFAISFLFFMTTLLFGVQIAMSVTEEKQTRVVEILVSSVPVRALLIGKVAAMTLLAFGQLALLLAAAVIGMRTAGVDTTLISAVIPAVGWFLPFFLVGFVALAALWAAVGALAARQEDVNGTSTPVQMLIMIPFFVVLSVQSNEAAMTVLSYIPFSAPVAMPIRLFTGEAAPWEPVIALLLLLLTAAATLAVGARIYQNSLLRTNGRTSLATAWRNT